jgi:drug/metabolite transporter (DMT)-like permease
VTTRPAASVPVSEPDATPLSIATAPGAGREVMVGYVFAAIGAVLFSAKGIIVKLAYAEGIDAETLLALRMLLSLPIYFVIGGLSVRDRFRRGASLPASPLMIQAALIGALGYWFASYMDFRGLALISAQFERLILFTYPLFVVVLGALFFKQPIVRRVLLAFGLSYAGLALIFTAKVQTMGADASLGAAFVTASALAFALYQLLAKQVIGKIGPRLFTCIAMSAAGAAAIVQFLLLEPLSALVVTPLVLGYGVMLAIGSTVIPSFFLNAALQRITPQANATIGMLSPVATIIMAIFILGEVLTLRDTIGTALVLGGIGWFTLGGRK